MSADPFTSGHRTDERPPFRYAIRKRVAFSDTDAQAVVYYGRYVQYFDEARTEYHRNLGSVLEAGDAGSRREFVMRASTLEYHSPARFDDLLEVFVRIARIGETSVTYELAAYRLPDGALLTTARQTLVHIDAATRATVPVPDALRRLVGAFEDAPVEP